MGLLVSAGAEFRKGKEEHLNLFTNTRTFKNFEDTLEKQNQKTLLIY